MDLTIDSSNVPYGPAFARSAARMLTQPAQCLRRKAVWGPKRLAALLLALVFGLTTGAFAQEQGNSGGHRSNVRNARPGRPHARVRGYKLDTEMQRRRSANPVERSSVIVTLVPGADLPPQFKRFA